MKLDFELSSGEKNILLPKTATSDGSKETALTCILGAIS
jgi:hypothetical protein